MRGKVGRSPIDGFCGEFRRHLRAKSRRFAAVALRNAPAGAVRAARVPPCGAGSFSTWKRNQKTLGGGRNRQERLHRSCLHVARPPEPPLREMRTFKVKRNFRRAKSGVPGCGSIRPHWGPEYAKFALGAVPGLRLSFLSQRSWCVSWREPQGAPLRKPGRSFDPRRGDTPGPPAGRSGTGPCKENGNVPASAVGAGALTCPPGP